MLPIDSRVDPDGSDETGTEGVRPAAVAVRPDADADADVDALRPSEDALLDSEPVCLRADPGFIGWLGTCGSLPHTGRLLYFTTFAGSVRSLTSPEGAL